MKYFSCVILSVFLCGCGEPSADLKPSTNKETSQAKMPKKHTNKLWTYLKEFRGKEKMPTLAEIEKKFGAPDEIVMDSESIMAGYYIKKQKTHFEFHNKSLDDAYY